jgi:hypothetical protein
MEFKRLIAERFALNLSRIHSLLRSFHVLSRSRAAGLGDPTDILRAAVILLHATLEDLLRSLEELQLQRPPRPALAPMMFPRESPERRGEPKITLADLFSRFRGQSVNDVVMSSVHEHLTHRTYNNVGDVKAALRDLKVRTDALPGRVEHDLAEMMKRRHQIAHQADVPSNNPRNFLHLLGIAPLTPDVVASWQNTVELLGNHVLDQFQEAA